MMRDKEKSKKYSALFFDVDGTLSDSYLGITRSAQYALKANGIMIEDETQLKHFIGPPLEETLANDYQYSDDQIKETIRKFREYYLSQGYLEHTIFPGIFEMIHELYNSGVALGIATSKPTTSAKVVLEQYKLLDYFQVISGSSPDHPRFHKTDILDYAIRTLGITKKDSAVMIGDRAHDIIAAKNCGIDSIGVLYGYGEREEIADSHPTFIVDTVEDLRAFLKAHLNT